MFNSPNKLDNRNSKTFPLYLGGGIKTGFGIVS